MRSVDYCSWISFWCLEMRFFVVQALWSNYLWLNNLKFLWIYGLDFNLSDYWFETIWHDSSGREYRRKGMSSIIDFWILLKFILDLLLLNLNNFIWFCEILICFYFGLRFMDWLCFWRFFHDLFFRLYYRFLLLDCKLIHHFKNSTIT